MGNTQTRMKPLYDGLKVTNQEYLKLADDGFKYDMIGGILYVSPGAFFEHGESQIDFGSILRSYIKKFNLGRVTNETDVFLPDDGDVLRPDVCFILNENRHIIDGQIHGTPDLVCEVLSKRTHKRDLGEKADRYLTNGVKEYWIVDPRDKSIQLWLNHGDHWEKRSSPELQSQLLPGLVIRRDEFFSE